MVLNTLHRWSSVVLFKGKVDVFNYMVVYPIKFIIQ